MEAKLRQLRNCRKLHNGKFPVYAVPNTGWLYQKVWEKLGMYNTPRNSNHSLYRNTVVGKPAQWDSIDSWWQAFATITNNVLSLSIYRLLRKYPGPRVSLSPIDSFILYVLWLSIFVTFYVRILLQWTPPEAVDNKLYSLLWHILVVTFK
jgi:hypothetical protein